MVLRKFQVRRIAVAIIATGGAILSTPTLALSPPQRCTALGRLSLPGARISGANEVAKGAFDPPPRPTVLISELQALRSFCRVQATIRPTSDSDIRVEVWLPSDQWNGRLVAVGNGGFSSHFDYAALARVLADGYAVVGSNAGHEGDTGNFAFGHPEKLIDWGYRAVHVMTVAAKSIVAARYGIAARWSYWASCSTGGRQGLNAAERYPDDFDGLAVGAPANPMTRLQIGSIWNTLAVNHAPDSFISRDSWAMIHRAVLAECDARDGVVDGLLADPVRCAFDPAALLCRSVATAECLTAGQVVALTAIYHGARNPRTGEQIYPGWAAGFEGEMPGPTANRIPQQDAIDTMRIALDDPAWDWHTLDFDRDVNRTDARGDATINAADPAKLRALFRHGGKLLLYHGWHDVGISALGTVDYYQRAVAANGGEAAISNSLRLFLAPGMNHCEGGDGPNQFDKLSVLAAWVERGVAPDRIEAAHFNSAGRVDRTRPLCPYPQVATYKGSGSSDDAANFVCIAAADAVAFHPGRGT